MYITTGGDIFIIYTPKSKHIPPNRFDIYTLFVFILGILGTFGPHISLKKLQPKNQRIINKPALVRAYIIHSQKSELTPTNVINTNRVFLVGI